MARHIAYLLMCLLVLPGCSFALEKKWFQAASPGDTRSHVTLTTLAPPGEQRLQYRYPPTIGFRDSNGTTWEVLVDSDKPRAWHVYRITADGRRVEVPLVEVSDAD